MQGKGAQKQTRSLQQNKHHQHERTATPPGSIEQRSHRRQNISWIREHSSVRQFRCLWHAD